MIIVHKSWRIDQVYRDPSGSLVGVVMSKHGLQILLISAYLPTNLDMCGVTLVWDLEAKDRNYDTQEEAHTIYSCLREWTSRHTYWLIGLWIVSE